MGLGIPRHESEAEGRELIALTPQGTTQNTSSDRLDAIPVKLTTMQQRLGPGSTGTSGAFEFQAVGPGIVRLQCLGSGSIANIAWGEGNGTWALNNGVALTSGSFFEFEFAVDGNDQIFLTGVTLARAFWRP